MYYIGLDVHKRIISYCVKDSSGEIYAEGSLPASPEACLPTGPHQSKAPEARQKLAHCVSGGIKFLHQKSPSPGGAADSSAPERISWEQQSAISEQEAWRGCATSQVSCQTGPRRIGEKREIGKSKMGGIAEDNSLRFRPLESEE